MLVRIIEPTSKADSLRVIDETGVVPVSYPTLNRRLPVLAKPIFRQALSATCATHARWGPASLVLYDVSTLLGSAARVGDILVGLPGLGGLEGCRYGKALSPRVPRRRCPGCP